MTNEQIKQIEDYLTSYCPDPVYRSVTDYLTQEQLLDIELEDLHEYLDDKGFFDVDIIYYSLAMRFLLEHDNSLTESIDLALGLGYEAQNLNSELLASLLATQMLGTITQDAINAAIPQYPFNDGDSYYTIEDNEVVLSCWDDISEELYDTNKLYFVSMTEAQKHITQTSI